jgi:aspartate/methionine/tyrosine aminotransferase
MVNFLVMAALLSPGDRMLVESPSYEPMYRSAELVGAQVDFFERRYEEGYRVDPDRLAAALTPRTRLVLLTNLHNPSGAYIDEATLAEIGRVAQRAGARVLVDEVYLEFLPNTRSAFHLGDVFVTTNSLTKVYGLNGLRCGWILAAPDIVERCLRVTNFLHGEGVLMADIVASAAFDRMDWLTARTRGLLEANRPMVDAFIAKHAAQIEWVPRVTGSLSFPRLKNTTGAELARVAREKYDTGIVPGEFFAAPVGTGQCDKHFRLGFGNTTDVVREGLAGLSKALSEM